LTFSFFISNSFFLKSSYLIFFFSKNFLKFSDLKKLFKFSFVFSHHTIDKYSNALIDNLFLGLMPAIFLSFNISSKILFFGGLVRIFSKYLITFQYFFLSTSCSKPSHQFLNPRSLNIFDIKSFKNFQIHRLSNVSLNSKIVSELFSM
jgi:hypothetical protein